MKHVAFAVLIVVQSNALLALCPACTQLAKKAADKKAADKKQRESRGAEKPLSANLVELVGAYRTKYRVACSGQLLLMDDNSAVVRPVSYYRFRGEKTINWETVDSKYLRVNGRIVGLDLVHVRGIRRENISTLIGQHSATLESVTLSAKHLMSKAVISALGKLKARRLILQVTGYWENAANLNKVFKRLGGQLYGLVLDGVGDLRWLGELKHLGALSIEKISDGNDLDLAPLVKLSRLRFLTLSDPELRINAEHLKKIKRLPRLVGLVIHGADVNKESLRRLSDLNQLRVLSVYNFGSEFDQEVEVDLKPLQALKQLKILKLNHMRGRTNLASALANLRHLQSLDLSGTHTTDADLRHLKDLMQLRVLNLAFTHVSGPGLANLKGLINLRILDLGATRLTDTAFPYIQSLGRLLMLNLSGTKVTNEGVSRLRHLKQLRYLSLNTTAVDYRALAHLSQLTELHTLYLRRHRAIDSGRVTDTGLAQLRRLTKLRELDLAETDLSDAGLKHLANMTRLRNLDLTGTKVTDAGPRHLSRLRQLRRLNLSETQISDAGLVHLRVLPRLRILDLAKTKVSDNGAAMMKAKGLIVVHYAK